MYFWSQAFGENVMQYTWIIVQRIGQHRKSGVTCGFTCVTHLTHDHFPDHLTYRTILYYGALSMWRCTICVQEKTCAWPMITLQPNVQRLLYNLWFRSPNFINVMLQPGIIRRQFLLGPSDAHCIHMWPLITFLSVPYRTWHIYQYANIVWRLISSLSWILW